MLVLTIAGLSNVKDLGFLSIICPCGSDSIIVGFISVKSIGISCEKIKTVEMSELMSAFGFYETTVPFYQFVSDSSGFVVIA